MENRTDIRLKNPFPGLRPFSMDEGHLFFGREGQSETIVNFLSDFRFASITGASGSGKSSLIYCGVIPLLYGGFISNAGDKWRIISTRPGNTPIMNLALSLAETDYNSDKEQKDFNTNYFHSVLQRHSLGLVDAVTQLNLGKNENLLIVVDQFEELFRFKKSLDKATLNNKDETETYIRLLVNTARQQQLPIYIILTMRSDFIGECSEYQDLTSLINKSNYLVPQMTRLDYEKVICGPVKVANATIEPRLVQHLLNSIEERHDQLPVLQHVMMRTWDFWSRHNTPLAPMSMRDYMTAGKLDNALSMHANEAYNLLNESDRNLCKTIFKSITEKGKEGQGIRRPASIQEISELAQAQPSDIIRIVELFREPGKSFLTPSVNTPLNPETVIDISHESLMRIWDKLKIWVEEEASASQMYLRLVELSDLFQRGKTGLIRPPDLHLALNWRKTQNPNRAWARKYSPAFEKTMVFLNTSEKKFQIEEENKIKIQRRALYRTRRLAIMMGVSAIGFMALGIYAYTQRETALREKDRAESYANLMKGEKDEAVQLSEVKDYERLKALHEKDSLDRMRMMQLFQKDEETQEVTLKFEEASKRSLELEQTSFQFEQQRQVAEQIAKQAMEGKSQAEIEKRTELRKRMLILSQTLGLKVTQVDDKQLSGLLAYFSYVINRENGGQTNQPEIYRGLSAALRILKGQKYNYIAGHQSPVKSFVFDPARNILYSTDNAGAILKWSFRKNNPTPTVLTTSASANNCLAITVDGRWMASGSEAGTIQLFNTLQPTQVPRSFNAHEGGVSKLKFVPGKNAMVSSGSDNKVKYWDLLSNQSSLVMQDANGINDIDVSPSGSSVICGTGNGRLLQYSFSTARTQPLFAGSSPIMAVAYDYEGEKIAVGDRSGKIYILNASSGKIINTINGHSSRVIDLQFSPDNRQLASSGLDGIIRIWNMTDLTDLPLEIKENENWVETLAYSPDGRSLLSSGNNNQIYIWPVRTENLASEICAYLTRQLTQQEWNLYIGSDMEYREACK